jgi:NitT/TauT family transport system permease protein
MNQYLKLVTPNKKTDNRTRLYILFGWIAGMLLYWTLTSSHYIPTPMAIIDAIKILFVKHHFANELLTSTWLCMKAIAYSTLISLAIALLSVIPLFKPFSSFSTKARFLSTVGLTFIFSLMTADTNSLKVVLLVFCITVFLLTSFYGIVTEVKKTELDYARTLKLNEWEAVWEVIILGKADQFLEAIKQNFAIAWIMLAMVENLCRAEGGIGVMLTQENKQFHLDAVYAIQIVILIVGIGLDWLLGFIREFFCPYSVATSNYK